MGGGLRFDIAGMGKKFGKFRPIIVKGFKKARFRSAMGRVSACDRGVCRSAKIEMKKPLVAL